MDERVIHTVWIPPHHRDLTAGAEHVEAGGGTIRAVIAPLDARFPGLPARLTAEPDFAPRHGLDQPSLVTLFAWSEAEYLARTEGSALRRAGYERWQRNLAVALGNGPPDAAAIAALRARRATASELVREHVDWALARLGAAATG